MRRAGDAAIRETRDPGGAGHSAPSGKVANGETTPPRDPSSAGSVYHGRITQTFRHGIPVVGKWPPLLDEEDDEEDTERRRAAPPPFHGPARRGRAYREMPSRDSSAAPSRRAVRGASSTPMTAAASQTPATMGNQCAVAARVRVHVPVDRVAEHDDPGDRDDHLPHRHRRHLPLHEHQQRHARWPRARRRRAGSACRSSPTRRTRCPPATTAASTRRRRPRR